jgi:hypothetical protein
MNLLDEIFSKLTKLGIVVLGEISWTQINLININ